MTRPNSLFAPQLQQRKTDPDPITQALKSVLQKRCEAILDPDSDDHIDYTERKSEWWAARAGGRILPKAIEQLAVGGLVVDDTYTQHAINIFQTIVDHKIVENCGGTNYGRPYHTWRDNCLDAGVSSAGLAISLDLLAASLSSEEITPLATYTIPFIDYLLENPPDREEKRPDWNMAAIGLVGLGLLGLVLHNLNVLDKDRLEQTQTLAIQRAKLFLEKGHDGQGCFFEGPAYGSATVHYLAPYALALARCGNHELVEHKGWELITHGLVHELIPSTNQPNPLNDCGNQFNIEWLALIASEQKNGLAQWLWQAIDNPPSDGSPWNPPDAVWSTVTTRYLMYYDPTVKPTSPDTSQIPPIQYFKNRGLIDIRSGWQTDDFFLSFLCDVFPAGGHRQADRNQFSLHALGESFAIDSGYSLERLPDTTEVLRLGALGEAHNLPLLQGAMQQRGQVTKDGIKNAELESPFPYIESEAGESYATASRFTRRVLCLPSQSNTPTGLIIADYLIPDASERSLLSWLLHTAPENQIDLQRDRFTITGHNQGNHCLVQIATPWPGRWRKDVFFDHPRMRYDWFWNPLFCIVALLPYRAEETEPTVTTQGSAEGCILSIIQNDITDIFLTAAPDQTVSYDDIQTNAEFAHIRIQNETVLTHRLAAGTTLTYQGQELA